MIHSGKVNYHGKIVLAPMVRIGELPTRLLALKYGADLVWGPEVVDKSFVQGEICKRVVNEKNKCIYFVKPPKNTILYSIHPMERSKLIFQLGSADPELAVKAAQLIAKDVAAIDLNCGCPKHFSVHSGMGAALLKNVDLLESILIALVQNIGIPYKIGISAKIRILEDIKETEALVRRICDTGIIGLTIHCRTISMRNKEKAIRDQLKMISKICREKGVACIANGDIVNRKDGLEVIKEWDVDGAMIARAAEKNPSCFRMEGLLPQIEIAQEWLRIAIQTGNSFSNTKFCILKILDDKSISRKTIFQPFQNAKSFLEMVKILGIDI
ncbi:hypothetical protein T552_00450 [Pneumocystis carinii B80]|uniref:DUS-like FMN-binding domain-containing protein n=1 Tax=Pneumocystis carinii (strain B80) TaxID=1408658 RepID=A0A0W4ZQW8_PNEC8|nr:hypothetical protein T552_00450 [Pneumocystis carinii B80]KTW30738.1 hypothetical protein T552_00450 [Pneumocystis carinii B80]